MKINKRVLSICLAVMLVAAMAIPAAAQTIVMGREYCGIGYGTSDTCNSNSYHCVIEVWDGQTTVRTSVGIYLPGGEFWNVNDGTTQVDMSVTSGSVGGRIGHIECTHYVDGNWASWESVQAG